MEYLDPWTSRAFAVADHQIAHVYVRDPADVAAARAALAGLPGIDLVLEGDDRRAAGLGHERAGELVLVAEPRRLVHLLLLARRRARAGLRAAGGDPPQAGLRPGRAVHGPGRSPGQGARGRGAGAQEDRHALRDAGRPAGPEPVQGDARAAARVGRRRARCCSARTRRSRATGSRRPTCATCCSSSRAPPPRCERPRLRPCPTSCCAALAPGASTGRPTSSCATE